MARLEPGMKAPAFTLMNQSEKRVSLKDFAGQRVVVYFYPADDTPGCTKEACQFNDQLSQFKGVHANVIGISPDGADEHVAFRSKFSLTFDLLSDPDK
jgi:peroxiredoxin Q/BCP